MEMLGGEDVGGEDVGGEDVGGAMMGGADSGGVMAVCGDEDVGEEEECDDGNTTPGDGCDSACFNELSVLLRGVERNVGRFGPLSSDRYTFTAHGPTTLIASTSDGQGGCPGDTRLYLFAANSAGTPIGNRLAYNDDNETGVCSDLNVEVEAGDYVVVVDDFFGAGLSTYTLDTFIFQAVTRADTFTGGYLDQGDDLFLFTPFVETVAEFETSDGRGGCPGDTQVRIYRRNVDGAREMIEFNDDEGEGLCSLISTTLQPDTYEIVVEGFLGASLDQYTLSIRLSGPCGDGSLDLGEECDDENDINGDGCSAECTLESICGDFILESPEECDDGNLTSNDGCDTLCTSEIYDIVRGVERHSGSVPEGEEDRWNFTVDDTSLYLARTIGCSEGELDTILTLHSVDDQGNLGAQIASNDDVDFPIDICSRLTDTLEAGDYAWVITGYNLSAAVGYDLSTRIWQDVTSGGTFQGQVAESGDDLYTLVQESDGPITIQTGDGMGGCPGDTILTIYTTNNQGERVEVISDDDGGEDVCSLIETTLDFGFYEVVVDGYMGDEVPPYVLNVSLSSMPLVEICDDGIDNDLNDLIDCDDEACGQLDRCLALSCSLDDFSTNHLQEEAASIEPGIYDDLIACVGANDWFSISLCAGGILDIDVNFTHADGDLDAVLFSELGTPLSSGVSITDNERVVYANMTDVEQQLSLQIFNLDDDGEGNTYQLDISEVGCNVDSGLIFSEYIEGSGNNKVLEIFNGSDEVINLSTCEVAIYYNGDIVSNNRIPFTTDLEASIMGAGDRYVMCNIQAQAELLSNCDQSTGSLSFNGNDAIALICDAVIVDVIGEIGFNPDTSWSGSGVSTVDQTLRRRCDIRAGHDGQGPFDPSVEWEGFPLNDFSGVGSHCP